MKHCITIIGFFLVLGSNYLAAQKAEITEDETAQEEVINIPFAIIEEVPIFPGCEETQSMESRRKCFSQQLRQHIEKHLIYPEEARKQDIEGMVNIGFTINPKGHIVSIVTRGNPILEKEAQRIIALLPRMVPGKHHNQNVSVPFFWPIRFNL